METKAAASIGLSSGLRALLPMAAGTAASLVIILPTVCAGIHNHDLVDCIKDYGLWIVLSLAAGTGVGATAKAGTKFAEMKSQPPTGGTP